ncbi:ADP-ribose pyrophosphatase [Staphylococcus simulans]|uniref:NUDIX hydrolase n=1 Tax=Staphylococcus simulans TaxID=1286 RepID=UPI000D1FB764|nr:NUDIX hydrolase [Staphylococcus simulans]PTI96048.1 ADP-ribose pyrophosphatase [Staphylococcus simulans]PTJ51064.1 ADP-ribose pyrophosphatase [Staphylococcus simulans]
MTPKHIVSASCVVINDENKILLIKSPLRGWEIPGGQIENGETIREGVIREVKEEAGVTIKLTTYCGVFQNTEHSIINHLFKGIYIDGTLTTSDESLEVGFFTYEEVMQKVTWGNFTERIRLCLTEDEQPFLVSF